MDFLQFTPDGKDMWSGFWNKFGNSLSNLFNGSSDNATDSSAGDSSAADLETLKDEASDLKDFSNSESLWDKLFSGFSSEQATALMDKFAREQFERNQQSASAAQAFSAAEAQKNRDWQEYMSNTSYQRAVKDLQAAGLNPVLAATGGLSGASTPSGASAYGISASGSAASVDTDKTYLAFLNTIISAFGNLVSSAVKILPGMLAAG